MTKSFKISNYNEEVKDTTKQKQAPAKTKAPVTAKPATKCTQHRSRDMGGYNEPSSQRTRAPLKGLHAGSSGLCETNGRTAWINA